ncbi:MAG: hypothetical protein JXR83_02535 [Deltaproteobacteria bacterium]|nr:hypothetical protein [Deltaproteobacteria bacterium]
MKRTFGILLATVFLGCGPMGNTLGLEGIYEGTMKVEGSGTFTDHTGASPTVYDSEYDNSSQTQMTIEPGYNSDAVLPGSNCVIALKAESDKLVLVESMTCTEVTEVTTTGAGNTSTTKETKTQIYNEVEITKNGDNKMKATMKASSTNLKEKDGEKQTETQLSLTLSFDGTRIANY